MTYHKKNDKKIISGINYFMKMFFIIPADQGESRKPLFFNKGFFRFWKSGQ